MDITVALAFQEKGALRLLNWLAGENALIFRAYDKRAARKGEAKLPGLYESGIRYETEEVETWSDYLNTLIQGHEDCDALAAIRAGELRARGWRAMRPRDEDDPVRYPGDEGYGLARRLRPKSIAAEVILTTRTEPGRPGLYHCVVKYRLPGNPKVFYDDPSARLGMLGNPDAPEVKDKLSDPRKILGQNGARSIVLTANEGGLVVGRRRRTRRRP